MGHMLVHIILPAVGADLGGNIFHNKGHAIPIKGDSCRTLVCLAMFADDALHSTYNLPIEGDFTSRERTHAQFFLMGVPHDTIDFP